MRRLAFRALTLSTMGLALLWTVGLMGWLDWPQDSIHEVLAPLILVVGVCDAIHLLVCYAAECRSSGGNPSPTERRSILVGAARHVGPACLVTTLTTAGAFLSFTTSSLDTFIRFGSIAAFGVMVCLLLTYTLLPLAAQWFPASESAQAGRATAAWEAALDSVVRTSSRRSGPILLVSLALSVACGFGCIRYLRIDTDWLESWGEESEVVRDIRFFEDRLGLAYSLEVSLGLPPGDLAADPKTLRTISKLAASLSEVDGLGKSTTVVTHYYYF